MTKTIIYNVDKLETASLYINDMEDEGWSVKFISIHDTKNKEVVEVLVVYDKEKN